jgi:hypothetical protein
MDLNEFCFPVEERPVYFSFKGNSFEWKDNIKVQKTVLKESSEYKSILREDNHQLISIVNKKYKLIENKELIDQLMEQLKRTDQKFEIEDHHSFFTDKRMRLHIKFPELQIKDDSDDGIALSLYLHNSYDMSEGVRMYWGAIRSICTNGMVFGKILAKFYSKHTQGFQMKELKSSIENTYKMIPDIQQRIEILDSLKVDDSFDKEVKDNLGAKLYKNIITENNLDTLQALTRLQLFHLVTNYISHRINHEMQTRYQFAASKLFDL